MTCSCDKRSYGLRIFLVIFLCLGLHSCSILSGVERQVKTSPILAVESHEQQIVTLGSWTVRARISVKTPVDSFSGDLRWSQIGNAYNVRLSGPFGSGALTIRGNLDRVILHTSDGQSFSDSTPEKLMRAQLGWNIPVSHVRYWLLGVPDRKSLDNQPTKLVDESGRYKSFVQSDCQVFYKDYYEDESPNLPRKISFDCDDLKSRIAVKAWEIH